MYTFQHVSIYRQWITIKKPWSVWEVERAIQQCGIQWTGSSPPHTSPWLRYYRTMLHCPAKLRSRWVYTYTHSFNYIGDNAGLKYLSKYYKKYKNILLHLPKCCNENSHWWWHGIKWAINKQWCRSVLYVCTVEACFMFCCVSFFSGWERSDWCYDEVSAILWPPDRISPPATIPVQSSNHPPQIGIYVPQLLS